MKKMFFLLAITFATSYSFAQQGQNVSPERPTQNNDVVAVPIPQTSFCPVSPPAVVVNNTINNNTMPGTGNGFLIQKQMPGRIIYRNTRPNVNFITNHNYFGDTAKTVVKERKDEMCCGAYGNHAHFMGLPPWFWSLLALVGIILLIAYLVDRDRRRNPPVGPSSVTHTHSHTHSHSYPPAPKPELVKPTMVDPKEAMEMAKNNGGTFSTRADGTFRVEFPKPEPVAKVEEKKAGDQQ